MLSGDWGELPVGRDAKPYQPRGALHHCCLGPWHGEDRQVFAQVSLAWGVPPAEWGNELQLLRRDTEWSLEGQSSSFKTISIHHRDCGVWGAELCLIVPDIHLAEFPV